MAYGTTTSGTTPYYGGTYATYHPPTTVNYYGSGCYNCGGWSTAGAAAAGAAVGMAAGTAAASANTAANAQLPADAFNRVVMGQPGMQERLFYMAPLSDDQRKKFTELWQQVKTELGK